jgi:prepilin-type N-terminal cleavage/methylation domain-containing protein
VGIFAGNRSEKIKQTIRNNEMNNPPRNIAGGFTLVELLVVIAIIALLMSIMMPTLQKARTAAQAVVCISNMKQQYVVQSAYAANNDGQFPKNGGNFPNYHHIASATKNNYPYRVDVYAAYKSYVGDAKIFLCPATASFASRNEDLGYYKNVKWCQPLQKWGWWYGAWNGDFFSAIRAGSNGQLGEVVRMSPYNWYANYKPSGVDATFANKADKWAITSMDLRASSAFISHELYILDGVVFDRGHGGTVSGPKVRDISSIKERASRSSPVTFGDGSVSKVPISKIKLRAWYATQTRQQVEVYW